MNLLNTWQWIHPPNIHIGTTATGIKTQYPSYCENVSITAHCLFSKLNHPHLLHNLTWFLITKKKYILITKLPVDWHAHEISTLNKGNFFWKFYAKNLVSILAQLIRYVSRNYWYIPALFQTMMHTIKIQNHVWYIQLMFYHFLSVYTCKIQQSQYQPFVHPIKLLSFITIHMSTKNTHTQKRISHEI